MARSRRRSEEDEAPPPPEGPVSSVAPPEGTTGRYLVVFREEANPQAVRGALANVAGAADIASAADFAAGEVSMQEVEDADAVFFDKLNVAVVTTEPQQVQALAAAAEEAGVIVAIEP